MVIEDENLKTRAWARQALTEPPPAIGSVEYITQRRLLIEEEKLIESLKWSVLRRKGTLSPARRVPKEILALIFSNFTQRFKTRHPGRSRVTRTNKIEALRLVCSQWNDVIENTCQQWTKFELCCYLDTDPPFWNPTLLRTWLQRSQGALLDVQISLRSSYRDDYNLNHFELSDSDVSFFWKQCGPVLAQSSRWRRLEHNVTRDLFAKVISPTPNNVSSLVHITIEMDDHSDVPANLQPTTAEYLFFANLRTLRIFEFNPSRFIRYHAPVLELLSLDGFEMSVAQLAIFIERMPNLAKIQLNDMEWIPGPEDVPSRQLLRLSSIGLLEPGDNFDVEPLESAKVLSFLLGASHSLARLELCWSYALLEDSLEVVAAARPIVRELVLIVTEVESNEEAKTCYSSFVARSVPLIPVWISHVQGLETLRVKHDISEGRGLPRMEGEGDPDFPDISPILSPFRQPNSQAIDKGIHSPLRGLPQHLVLEHVTVDANIILECFLVSPKTDIENTSERYLSLIYTKMYFLEGPLETMLDETNITQARFLRLIDFHFPQ